MSARRFARFETADGGVARVVLDRPERLNAVSEELYADLERALDQAAGHPATRALLLCGEGRAFCAGADLKAHATRDRDSAQRMAYVWSGQRVCRALQRMPQPVVAAVQGYAIGAGAEIAISADLVICADDAQFQFPEVGLGTFVGGGATYRLPRLVGQQRAKELLLLGGRLSAAEAVAWGLASRAVPAEDLAAVATAVAERLAAQPTTSLRLAKDALDRAGLVDADAAMAFEAEALLACLGGEDWARGVRDFADQQRPEGGA